MFNFKKKDKIRRMSWKDITTGQFMRMQALQHDENYLFNAAAIARNIDFDDFANLPLNEVSRIMEETKFLVEETPKPTKAQDAYTLNGRRYVLTGRNGDDLTLGQYIDFQSIKDYERNIPQIMATILVPEGCNYNEGYRMEQAVKDMEMMPVCEAMGISRFFFRQSMRYVENSLTYSERVLTWRLMNERDRDMKTQIHMALTGIQLQKKALKEQAREFGFS